MTPFLALLLEKDPHRTLPFDTFFEEVAMITSKVPLDAFCPSMFLPMMVYINATDKYVGDHL